MFGFVRRAYYTSGFPASDSPFAAAIVAKLHQTSS
jgi:hypothetical protein